MEGSRAGTGIGLALVHAFVEMQGGRIAVDSDGRGTTFTATFPRKPLPADAGGATPPPPLPADGGTGGDPLPGHVEQPSNPDAPVVLVIDDNADIRAYVSALLCRDYRVLTAADGEAGLAQAQKFVPDVVVCDVMMPGVDGIECCRRLKGSLSTSHIPVILLTACSLDEQRIRGYDGGADSYISKPFSSRLLLSRIRNLLDNRCRLRQFFTDGQLPRPGEVNDLDRDFVARFKALVEERMGDSALNVEDLGHEMGVSRVQLYRKLKSLTNSSPVELLRRIRLQRASALLASSDRTVSEVAYEVGFSSPSYFTKCYKEEFKESPTERRRK